MAIFPESATLRPLLGYNNTPLENVHRNPSEAGNSQIRDVWGGNRFRAEFDMKLRRADALTLLKFHDDTRATTYTFFDFDPEMPFTEETIGVGNGVTLAFTIEAKETTEQVVEVADGAGGWTIKTAGVHYNVSAGTGALGEDRVVFTAGNAPPAGRVVRVSYVGRHRYECETLEFTWQVVGSTGRKLFHIVVLEA